MSENVERAVAAPGTAAQPGTAPPTPGVAVQSVPADDTAAHRTRLQLTMIFRRWRHLLVFIGSLVVLEIVGGHWIYDPLSRPRPYGVWIIGSWGGYSAPSVVMFVFTFFLVGAVYCLVVPGRPRTQAKIAVAVLVALLGIARLYLAVDHPDAVLFGVALAVAIPVAAFRFFTPNEVFPVVYRRGQTAHVDVTGRRVRRSGPRYTSSSC